MVMVVTMEVMEVMAATVVMVDTGVAAIMAEWSLSPFIVPKHYTNECNQISFRIFIVECLSVLCKIKYLIKNACFSN